jgi:hypothetical protein
MYVPPWEGVPRRGCQRGRNQKKCRDCNDNMTRNEYSTSTRRWTMDDAEPGIFDPAPTRVNNPPPPGRD